MLFTQKKVTIHRISTTLPHKLTSLCHSTLSPAIYQTPSNTQFSFICPQQQASANRVAEDRTATDSQRPGLIPAAHHGGTDARGQLRHEQRLGHRPAARDVLREQQQQADDGDVRQQLQRPAASAVDEREERHAVLNDQERREHGRRLREHHLQRVPRLEERY